MCASRRLLLVPSSDSYWLAFQSNWFLLRFESIDINQVIHCNAISLPSEHESLAENEWRVCVCARVRDSKEEEKESRIHCSIDFRIKSNRLTEQIASIAGSGGSHWL